MSLNCIVSNLFEFSNILRSLQNQLNIIYLSGILSRLWALISVLISMEEIMCACVCVYTSRGIVLVCSESKHVQFEVHFEHSPGEC